MEELWNDEDTYDERDLDFIHFLTVTFMEKDDGSIDWFVVPDRRVENTFNLSLHGMAETGTPLTALAVRALWKLCENGVVRDALERVESVRRAVELLHPSARGPEGQGPDLVLNVPMGNLSIN